MQGLFGFLALAAFVAFIIGMIKPQVVVFWGQKKSRGVACLYLVAMVVFSLIASAGSGSSAMTTTGTNSRAFSSVSSTVAASSEVTPASTSSSASSIASSAVPSSKAPSSTAPVTKKIYVSELGNGNYTAGIDFPAGTYDITAIKGKGNVSSSNMYSGGLNAMMGTGADDMYEKDYKNVEFPDGTILTVADVTIKIASKEEVDSSNLKKRENTATKSVTLSSGNFIAGKDFEAGIYNITAVKGSGNVSSDNMYEGGLNAVMGVKADDMYQKEFKNIVLSKDVKLTISSVTIKLEPSK